ncbi:hypothetical protein QR98_0030590 [Sarcoptes scabiei]|nr:hypothetical protein QR98_0030590 [Sarcoptes scabiei]
MKYPFMKFDEPKGSQNFSEILIDNQVNHFDFQENLDNVNSFDHNFLSSSSINISEINDKELIYLAHVLRVAVKPWLDYGQQIGVSSIVRNEFPLLMKRSIFAILKEFKEYIAKFSSDMRIHFLLSLGQQCFEFDCESEIAYNETGITYMILLRHESLWKTKSIHCDEDSFVKNFIGKIDSNKFEFSPSFCVRNMESNSDSNPLNTCNDMKTIKPELIQCLSPRQKFLLIFIEGHNLTLYLYNWNHSLRNNIISWFAKMVLWHNSRSVLLQSLVLQKAGIFHNNPFRRYSTENLMSISNFPCADSRRSNSSLMNLNIGMFQNFDMLLKYEKFFEASNENREHYNQRNECAFDIKNYDYVFSDLDHNQSDLFKCFFKQFNSKINVYIKDLRDMSKVWQLHGTKLNHPTMDKLIQHVKEYGRLSHFCLTPFLFSHKWRFVVSFFRDHSMPIQAQRARHMSGGNILKQAASEQSDLIGTSKARRSRRKSGPPNIIAGLHDQSSSDEVLDMAVFPHYIQEYVQYLQSLGFSSIKSQKVIAMKKNLDSDNRIDSHTSFSHGKLKSSNSIQFGSIVGNNSRKISHSNRNEYEKFFLIKTVFGGFYLFEVGFSEPFFYSHLYSIDSKRFISWNKNNSLTVINFLDELDSIMVQMHLHSFTYDYHLRAIHSYILGRQLFRKGYNLISFLDDFIKYYQKSPNYARNHIYSESVAFFPDKISADQLFNYLIKHSQNYGITVFSMKTNTSMEQILTFNEDNILIHLSSYKIPYFDANGHSQEDCFDVALLVSYRKSSSFKLNQSKELALKFYLLLTSQRELYPKLHSIRDKGLFRTVRTLSINKDNRINERGFRNENSSMLNFTYEKEDENKSHKLISTTNDDLQSPKDRRSYAGISDERINYLGYFNANEIVMLNILAQKVSESREYLEEIIKAAEIDCRRDCLWESLVESLSIPNSECPMNIEDFNELLSLVKSIRLDEYDDNLLQFNGFNSNWYRSLIQKLELKFDKTNRKFIRNDSLKMAFFKNHCKDCFIMLHLRNDFPAQVEFKIVFRQSSSTIIDRDFLKKLPIQHHELVEEFVNSCISHMWSVMLS